MKGFFYSRLGLKNLSKNKNVFLPFLIVSSFMVMAMYLMLNIKAMAQNGVFGLGGRTLSSLYRDMVPVMGVIMLIILLYTSSFVMKQRYKEIGLYSIMGMQKRNIARLMVTESFYMYVFSLLSGLALGFIFSKLMALFMANLIGVYIDVSLHFDFAGAFESALYFLGIYGLSIFFNLIRIVFLKPLAIVQSQFRAEKEPKGNIILGLIGLTALGYAYYTSQSQDNPLQALIRFFPAVLAVVVGTYLLFISGSIIILKLLKKNKGIYYKKANFLNISTMLYRMKKNAVGLASICLLSTVILVTVSGSFGLYMGIETLVSRENFADASLTVWEREGGNDLNKLDESARAIFEESGLNITNSFNYEIYITSATVDKNTIINDSDIFSLSGAAFIYKHSDVEKLISLKLDKLNKGEVYIQAGEKFESDTVNIFGNEFKLKAQLDNLSGLQRISNIIKGIVIISSDEDFYSFESNIQNYMYRNSINYSLSGSRDNKLLAAGKLREMPNEHTRLGWSYWLKEERNQEVRTVFGGLMFVGMFMVGIFLVTMGMIIFYKQISEGMEDRKRFALLKKVGLSDGESRKIIVKQVLSVFFMPVILAVVHLLFSLKITGEFLKLFGFFDVKSYIISTFISVASFSLIYFVMYFFSSRAYYRLINSGR